MKDFFKSMFSNGDGVSSKRFSAFFTLFNIIVLAYIATFMSDDKVTPEFMFDALALIAGGGLGLTVVEKIFSNKGGKDQQNTTSSIPPATPPTQSAEPALSDTAPENCPCGSDKSTCPNCKPLE
jgi:hypothetical protein